jgi:hypothetical protein
VKKTGRLAAACTGGALVAAPACAPHARTTTEGAAGPASEIMSFAAYQNVEHEEPYVYELSARGHPGALLYFGSRHTYDPEDGQLRRLARRGEEFRPTLALTEGGELELAELSKAEIVRRYGEGGMVRWLARRDSVPARSLDPKRGDEVRAMLDEGWSGEELMVLYTLRNVVQSNRQRQTVEYREVLPRYLESLVDRLGLEGPTTFRGFEAAIEELLPELDDWTPTPPSYLYPGPQEPGYFTNRLSTASNEFRDRYHVRSILDAVQDGERAFVVAGSAHAVMQEPALRARIR